MPTPTLIQKLRDRSAVIGIVGMGYVGLPLMLRFNEVGYRVIGIDIDKMKVDRLNNGESYIEHVTPASIATAKKRGLSGYRRRSTAPVDE